jgi:hypothetical protein
MSVEAGVFPQPLSKSEKFLAETAYWINQPLVKLGLTSLTLLTLSSLDEIHEVAAQASQQGQSLCDQLNCFISGSNFWVEEAKKLVDPEKLNQLTSSANCFDQGIHTLGQSGAAAVPFEINPENQNIVLCGGQQQVTREAFVWYLDNSVVEEAGVVGTGTRVEVIAPLSPAFVKDLKTAAGLLLVLVGGPLFWWKFGGVARGVAPSDDTNGPDPYYEEFCTKENP